MISAVDLLKGIAVGGEMKVAYVPVLMELLIQIMKAKLMKQLSC